MTGLSFLSKKSCHTSNIKNIEKVWIAEQKAEQEKKKFEKFQKQRQEERQIQELQQLHAANGQTGKRFNKAVDNTLDWMYEIPSKCTMIQDQYSEEYFLGKLFNKSKEKPIEVAAKVKIDDGKGQKWIKNISSKSDIFSKLHEDPLLMIKQQEQQKNSLKIRQHILDSYQIEEHSANKPKKLHKREEMHGNKQKRNDERKKK